MGKTRDSKVPIMPSKTRQGTTLNTSIALDSASVLSKLVSPPSHPHTSHAASFESDTVSDEFDDASTVLDETGSLGPFLDSRIAKAKEIESAEKFDKSPVTPTVSPEIRDYVANFPEDGYIEVDEEFSKDFMACDTSNGPDEMLKLFEKYAMKIKFVPDPKFATSPIDIKDADYDFSVDLSLISLVEADLFVVMKMMMLL